MNIGIDLDGVLFDTESMYRAYSQIYNVKHCNKQILDREELLAQNRYEWSNEEFLKFIDNCLVDIQTNAPVMHYAKQVIQAMSKNNKLFVISSRGLLSEKEIEITNKRFKDENLKFEKVVFNAKDKLKSCKDLNIDLMIEDNYNNVKKISENGIKCLYFRDLVIRHCTNENVKEVRNWGDICVELINLGLVDAKDVII